MTKTKLLLIFLSISLNIFSQAFYDKGIKYFENGDYLKSDSMFTLIIEDAPFRDAYFNRAAVRLKMNNMRGFCIDIKNASLYGDKESDNLNKQYCLDIDTIYYSDNFNKVNDNPFYTEIIYTEKYFDLTEGFLFDKGNKLIAKFKIQNNYKWFELTPNMPEFNGGEINLSKFLVSNLVYPNSEMDAYRKYPGTSEIVDVQFDISKTGKVENVKLSDDTLRDSRKYLSKDFVKEALRIVKLLPDFKRGTFMGEPVVVRRVVPIKFNFIQSEAKADRSGVFLSRETRVEIKVDTIKNELKNFSIISKVSSPSISSLIDFAQYNDSINKLTKNITIDYTSSNMLGTSQTVLVVNNPTDYLITFNAKIKRNSDDMYEYTSVTPLQPHISSMETWPYMVGQIHLYNFKIKK
jgi:hypothetical protein